MAIRIILTTIGSLGDLHPFLAIGRALRARGAEPVLAVAESHVAKARAAGLEAAAVVPSLEVVAADLGMSTERFTREVIREPASVAKLVLLPYFRDSFDRLDALAEGADLIAGSSYMFAAAALAEKRGLPYAAMVLQPLAFLSNYDPPLLWEYPVLALAPKAGWQVTWNRLANVILHVEVRRRYSFALNRARRSRGLGPVRTTPIFGAPANSAVTLGMFSPVIGRVQPDFPPNSHIVGFPQFDSDSGRDEPLPADLEAFLAAGEPPIVFTLGSLAIHSPGRFFAESREAARRLGRRSILLTGNDDKALDAPDCLSVRYAPHSLLFPRAAVIVHHGGIGTTGQALRSGRPQLVVPHLGDQPDNAARVARLGVGLTLKHRRYQTARAADLLGRLFADMEFGDRAARIGDDVRAETAAETAADILLETVAKARRTV